MFRIATARVKAGTVGQVLFNNEIVWESSPKSDDPTDMKDGRSAVQKANQAAQDHLRKSLTNLLGGN